MLKQSARLVVRTSVSCQGRQKLLASLLQALLLLLFFSYASLSFAQGIEFSLQPDPDISSSANTSYFVYDDLKAGTVVEDAIRISNRGQRRLHLTLFASDAATASNGGITFPTESGEKASKIGAWLQLSQAELTLEAGETGSVPFRLLIPDEVSVSGEYAAGIVVQEAVEAPQQESHQEAVGTKLVERAALTVLARVEGASPQVMQPKLEIASLKGEFGGIQQVIMAELYNRGNAGSNAQGELTIYSADGELLHTFPIRLGYILAGDSLTYQLTLASKLEPAEYEVKLRLDYEANNTLPSEGGSANHSVKLAFDQAQKADVPVIEAPEVEVEEGVLQRALWVEKMALLSWRTIIWLIFIVLILLSLRSLTLKRLLGQRTRA
jgi:hypothetical protein